MPRRHPLVQSLVNAYEAHDRTEFDRLLGLMEQRLSAAAVTPANDCARGAACVCLAPHARELCSYRIAKPEGGRL